MNWLIDLLILLILMHELIGLIYWFLLILIITDSMSGMDWLIDLLILLMQELIGLIYWFLLILKDGIWKTLLLLHWPFFIVDF